jgi:hypothetical protein
MQIQGPVVQRCNYAAATSMPSIAIYAIHRAAGKVDSNLAQSNVEGDGNEFPGHLRDWRPPARFELALPPPESQKTTARSDPL